MYSVMINLTVIYGLWINQLSRKKNLNILKESIQNSRTGITVLMHRRERPIKNSKQILFIQYSKAGSITGKGRNNSSGCLYSTMIETLPQQLGERPYGRSTTKWMDRISNDAPELYYVYLKEKAQDRQC